MSLGRPKMEKGFTLVELAVVAGVLAVLVGMVLPSIVEDARTDMGLEAIEEMQRIQSAAVLFFHNSVDVGAGDQAYDARWPGQDPAADAPPDDCRQIAATAAGHLQSVNVDTQCAPPFATEGCNPWQQPYRVSLAGRPESCNFRVITSVPTSLVAMFQGALGQGSRISQGACGAACTANLIAGAPPIVAPAGFTTCCSTITRPGLEASLDSYHPSLEDVYTDGSPAQAVAFCAQLSGVYRIDSFGNHVCRVGTGQKALDINGQVICNWYSGRCPNGRSAMGTNGSKPPRVYCCRTTN